MADTISPPTASTAFEKYLMKNNDELHRLLESALVTMDAYAEELSRAGAHISELQQEVRDSCHQFKMLQNRVTELDDKVQSMNILVIRTGQPPVWYSVADNMLRTTLCDPQVNSSSHLQQLGEIPQGEMLRGELLPPIGYERTALQASAPASAPLATGYTHPPARSSLPPHLPQQLGHTIPTEHHPWAVNYPFLGSNANSPEEQDHCHPIAPASHQRYPQHRGNFMNQ